MSMINSLEAKLNSAPANLLSSCVLKTAANKFYVRCTSAIGSLPFSFFDSLGQIQYIFSYLFFMFLKYSIVFYLLENHINIFQNDDYAIIKHMHFQPMIMDCSISKLYWKSMVLIQQNYTNVQKSRTDLSVFWSKKFVSTFFF